MSVQHSFLQKHVSHIEAAAVVQGVGSTAGSCRGSNMSGGTTFHAHINQLIGTCGGVHGLKASGAHVHALLACWRDREAEICWVVCALVWTA